MNSSYYNEKNILITGASSGIGELIAKYILKLNGNIINWDIQKPQQEELENNKYKFYSVDLSDKSQIYNISKKVIEKYKTIDVIINCAGIVSGNFIQNIDNKNIEKTFAVNALSLFYITKAFFNKLKNASNPKIVTISSAAGIIATAKMTDYSASKFAAVGFMDALRNELNEQNSNIKTLIVLPYYINTGMFEGVKTKVPFLLPILKKEYVAKRIVSTIPTNRKRLIMPRFASISALVKAFPVTISDFIVNLFGLNKSMENFIGRK